MEPIRLLVADDHEIVRKGIRSLLETQPGLGAPRPRLGQGFWQRHSARHRCALSCVLSRAERSGDRAARASRRQKINRAKLQET